MTFTPTILNPYRVGICWHGMKAAEANGPARFCGESAVLCSVRRSQRHTETESPLALMYLCGKHREALAKRGYVTKVMTGEELRQFTSFGNLVAS